jgi:hypothetical protein
MKYRFHNLPAIFILLTLVFGASEAQQFIYFQF